LVLLGHPAAAIVGDAETANWAIVRPALKLSSPRGVCSAAMVGRDLALTAAHCVTAISGTYCVDTVSQFDLAATPANCVMVPASFNVAGPNSAWIDVKEIVLHPEYSRHKRQGPDLALIQLVKPLPAGLTPPLFSTRPIRTGDRLTIAGYGINDSGKADGTARMATLTVLSADRHNTFELATRAMIGERPMLGACGGDSGAPAYDLRLGAPFLVGIVFGGSCGVRTSITAIHPYREWISDTAKRLDAVLGP
jgi:hypothetical protein